MHELKAIIFDMDGTLADTEEIHRQAFNCAFSEFDLEWRWSREDYKHLLHISGGRERICNCLSEKNTLNKNQEEIERYAKLLHKRKSEIYREILVSENIKLRPGVERLILEAIKENVIMAIATSSSLNNLKTLLHNTLGDEAINWFKAIVTCDHVVEKKPDPAVYRQALVELDLRPNQCLVIEDAQNGNLAALGAGLKTIITTHYFTVDDNFEGASLILDQLGEPDQAFQSNSGITFGSRCVDLQLLQSILSMENTNSSHETSNEDAALATQSV